MFELQLIIQYQAFMHFFQNFQNSCAQMVQFQSRKAYQKRNIIQNYNSKFAYQRGSKYILLTEEKTFIDPYDYEYGQFREGTKIIKSYVLDEGLAIVWEGNTCRNFQKELQMIERQRQNQSQKSNQQQGSYWSLPQLSYQTKTFQISSLILAPIQYRIFPSLTNFIVGRYNFVRNIQSHKIASDSISKQHCQILHYKGNSAKVQNYLNVIKKLLTTLTPSSSKCRKIPNYLWANIFDFLKPVEKYVLSDFGSRNGTWVYEIGTQIYKLQQCFDYQFERQSYCIHISKCFTSKDTQGQSIQSHNEKAHQIVEQFKKEVNWNYYERANKIMIVQDVNSVLAKSDQKIQILIFKLKYRDYHEYYLLAVNQGFQKKYSVGCKYDIDVNPEQYDWPSLHGKIYISDGKWMIESFQKHANGMHRKVWMKIPKDYKYVLSTKKSYKVRLGSSYCLNLDFKNF